jgi:hypothetical protein
MKLKNVIPKMEETFGVLEFAGEGDVEQRWNAGRMEIVSRTYNLYSSVQRADNIEVVLPPEAGEKKFAPETRVKLINPRLGVEGRKIQESAFSDYVLYADDLIEEGGNES